MRIGINILAKLPTTLFLIVSANVLIVYNHLYTATLYYQHPSVFVIDDPVFVIVFLLLCSWQFILYKQCKNLPSTIIVTLMCFLLVAPVVLLPFFNKNFNLLDYIPQILVLLTSIHLIVFTSSFRIGTKGLRGVRVSRFYFKVALVVLMVLGIVQLIVYFGEILSLNWGEMYDRRLLAREIFSQSLFLSYYNSFFGAVLIPFCALYGVVYNSKLVIALSIIGAIFSFAAFGGKGVFFSPILGILLGIYFKKTANNNFFRNMIFMLLIFLSLCLLEILVNDSVFLNFYGYRRMFYVPAKLTYQYWDYFSQNSVYLMSDSLLSSLFGGVEQEYPKARLIGGVYYGKYIMNANVNIFGTAYGDFGLIGMPIIAIFAGLTARIINMIYLSKNSIIVVAYSVFIGLVWTQGGFHTSFLSNGLIYSLILLLFIPKVNKSIVA